MTILRPQEDTTTPQERGFGGSNITALAVINYILQLLFMRLTRHEETHIKLFDLQSVSFTGVAGKIRASEVVQWYSVQYWVVPFTGWSTDYRYVGKNSPQFFRLTKNRIIKSDL